MFESHRTALYVALIVVPGLLCSYAATAAAPATAAVQDVRQTLPSRWTFALAIRACPGPGIDRGYLNFSPMIT